MNHETKNVLYAKNDFYAKICHDAQIPINHISLIADMLLEDDLSDVIQQRIQHIISSINSVALIIDDLLSIAQIEQNLSPENDLFNLIEVIDAIIQMYSWQTIDKNIHLGIIIHHDVPVLLKGDAERLRQIIRYLVSLFMQSVVHEDLMITISVIENNKDFCELLFSINRSKYDMKNDTQIITIQNHAPQKQKNEPIDLMNNNHGFTICKQFIETMGGHIDDCINTQDCQFIAFRIPFDKQPENKSFFIKNDQQINCQKHILVIHEKKLYHKMIDEYALMLNIQCDHVNSVDQGIKYIQQSMIQKIPISTIFIDYNDLFYWNETIPKEHIIDCTIIVLIPFGKEHELIDPLIHSNHIFLFYPITFNTLHHYLTTKQSNIILYPPKGFHLTDYQNQQKKPMKILLVDDSEINLEVTKEFLCKWGYSVDIAKNGKQALYLLRKNNYLLIIMDIQMPELDGLSAVRIIRNSRSNVMNHHVPIIAVTACARDEDKKNCFKAGINHYISKPIYPKILKEIITQYDHMDNHNQTINDIQPKNIQQDSMNDHIIFDKQTMLERFEGDYHFVIETINDFLPDIINQLSSLKQTVMNKNKQAVSKIAHFIKGNALTICALQIHNVADEIENAVDKDEWDMVEKLIHTLDHEINSFQKEIPK